MSSPTSSSKSLFRLMPQKDVLAYYLLKAGRTEQTSFLCAFRSFVSTSELLETIITSYAHLDSKRDTEGCTKLVEFLQLWVSMFFYCDFRPRQKLIDRALVWASSHLDGPAGNNVKMQLLRKDDPFSHPEVMNAALPVPSAAKMNHKFLDWSSKHIADHMSLIEADLYNMLQPSEFIDLAWQKDNREELAPTLCRMAARFNSVSFWVAATIVYRPEAPRTSTKVICKWINVAIKLWRLGNFQALMQVVSGLNHGAVQRLKITWGTLAQKYIERFTMLDQLLSPMGGYKNYRDALGKCTSSVIVPYLPSVLGDLAMQREGNPTMVEGKVNLDKIEMTGARIYEALRFQPARYNHLVPDNSLIMYFLSTSLPMTSEDDLYEQSRVVEPLRTVMSKSVDVEALSRRRFSLTNSTMRSSMSSTSMSSSGLSIPRSLFDKVRTRRGSIALPSGSPVKPSPSTAPVTVQSSSPSSSVSDPLIPMAINRSVSGTAILSKNSSKSELEQAKITLLAMSKELTASQEKAALSASSKMVTSLVKSGETETRLSRSGSWPPVRPRLKIGSDQVGSEKLNLAPLAPLVPSKLPVSPSPVIVPATSPKRSTAPMAPVSPKGKEEMVADEETTTTSTTSLELTNSDESSKSPGRVPGQKPVVRILFPPNMNSTSAISSNNNNNNTTTISEPKSYLPPPPSTSSNSAVLTSRVTTSQKAAVDSLKSRKDPSLWSESDVGLWLSSLGLAGYASAFAENSISGRDLADLSDSDLVDLGVTKIGHKKTLLAGIDELFRRNGSSNGTTSSNNNKSPRPSVTVAVRPSPRPLSPRHTPAITSPRGTTSTNPTMYVKIKVGSKANVVDVPRSCSYKDLLSTCSKFTGKTPVSSMHFLDVDGEHVRITGDKDVKLLMDSHASTSNVTIVVNK